MNEINEIGSTYDISAVKSGMYLTIIIIIIIIIIITGAIRRKPLAHKFYIHSTYVTGMC